MRDEKIQVRFRTHAPSWIILYAAGFVLMVLTSAYLGGVVRNLVFIIGYPPTGLAGLAVSPLSPLRGWRNGEVSIERGSVLVTTGWDYFYVRPRRTEANRLSGTRFSIRGGDWRLFWATVYIEFPNAATTEEFSHALEELNVSGQQLSSYAAAKVQAVVGGPI